MANYDRFWDLHVTNNGWYDFVSQIQEQQVYQHLTHEVDLPQTLNLIETPNPNDASIIHPRDIEPLPDKGVVASTVTLDDIEFKSPIHLSKTLCNGSTIPNTSANFA